MLHGHPLHDDSLHAAQAEMMGERQQHHVLHGQEQPRQRVPPLDAILYHHRHERLECDAWFDESLERENDAV